jgi:hypothetical protein
MSASIRERIASEVAREGYRISVLHTEDEVTIHVRKENAENALGELQPALPSLPRIMVWAEGCGMIHDRIVEPVPWGRLMSAITKRPVQTPETQVEALTEELLAEMRVGIRNPKVAAL